MTEFEQAAAKIPPILLVGCGRMGSAMLSGWREQGLSPSFAVDPFPGAASFSGPDLTVVADAAALPSARLAGDWRAPHEDYSRPLQLLARALSFHDPFSGKLRYFESTLRLD